MNESLKTIVFIVIAAAVALAAWLGSPSRRAPEDENVRNQQLYPEFTDPLKVARLEIVKYDEARGQPERFEVAQVAATKGEHKGKVRWSIPSHFDYPADAKDQMAAAGAALVGLKIIDKVSDDAGAQPDYGVVDPDPKSSKPGVTGVGQRVILKDKDGRELLALVIGKPVPDRTDQRYVRKVGGSEIYVVQVKTDKLSTKFEDWIEPNLLQINTMDLKDLFIRDYAIRMASQGMAIKNRGRLEIGYNDGEPHWKILKDQKFVLVGAKDDPRGEWVDRKREADEEPNAANLDKLKTALDDLKIVDVNRKPDGLSKDLKVSPDFIKSQETVDSLQDKGFFAAPLEENGPIEIFSNDGEIRVLLKGGVQYVLRFGQITGTGPASKGAKDKDAKDKKKPGDKGKDGDGKSTGLNRYLFVMAEFNADAIPKPQFEKMPEPAKAKEAEKTPAEEKKPEAAKPDEKKPADKKPEDKKADEKKPAADKKADANADKKAEEAERARIEKDNKRKQEEYDRQIADGQKKVAELNARFADWYYVISDEEYQKIHLSRDQIVMKKPKKEDKKGGEGAMPGPAGPNPPVDLKTPASPAGEPAKAQQNGPAAK
jgi:hypothetical protein